MAVLYYPGLTWTHCKSCQRIMFLGTWKNFNPILAFLSLFHRFSTLVRGLLVTDKFTKIFSLDAIASSIPIEWVNDDFGDSYHIYQACELVFF